VDIKEASVDYAKMIALSKISKYEAECNAFEKKYQIGFEEFKKRVEGRVDEEVFKEEDDLLDWEFAWHALNNWKEKLEFLEREK
jgi:hypothetical protein